MTGDAPLTKSQSELVAYLFDPAPSPVMAPLVTWIAASPRYAAFVARYKDKIRKKLRVTREPGAEADLLYELKIAADLLREPRFELAYEPYASAGTRGPDYAVTYRANFTFNIEVTHKHGDRDPDDHGDSVDRGDGVDRRLIDVLCGKLRQMLPGMANLLYIVTAPRAVERLDLPAHVAWIKEKAERRDPQFYARQHFENPAGFFKYYERLTGLVLYDASGANPPNLWTNPQSRVKLPAPLKNILTRG